MNKPRRIEEITIEALRAHRWCYYEDDEGGYNIFEHVVPDNHPGFSEHVEEIELVEFEFHNGKVVYGMYDGSESFHIIHGKNWLSFWYGVAKPNENQISEFSRFLSSHGLTLPVVARTKWSKRIKIFKGMQYINENGEVCEISI